MKFQPDHADGVNTITAPRSRRLVWVGATGSTRSVLVPWRGEVLRLAVAGFDDLRRRALRRSCWRWQPEVVIFGSGARLRFVAPGAAARR